MHTFSVPLPIDLLRSLAPLVASSTDPTIRVRPDRVVRASWTPEGPVTLDVRAVGTRRFSARADGPGRTWALDRAPGLLGADDHLDGFEAAHHPLVARAHHHRPDLRIVRTGCVQDVLVPAILAQRVTSREAARSWTRIVAAWGRPAPGSIGLRLPPTPDELADRPYWEYHRLGVERSRAARIVSGCRNLEVLQAALDGGSPAAARMAQTPGIGPWTAALICRVAGGDADAVEIGDYHVKNHVAYALAGEPRGSDERMMELLEPFAGHRGRVVRLLGSASPRPPAFGARRRIVPVDRM